MCRQIASPGTLLGVANSLHRYRNQRGWVFWGGGSQPTSPSATGSGQCCKLPAWTGADRRPQKGFLALCAARLSLSLCVDLLVCTCSYACDWREYMACPPHRELGVHVPCVPPPRGSDVYARQCGR